MFKSPQSHSPSTQFVICVSSGGGDMPWSAQIEQDKVLGLWENLEWISRGWRRKEFNNADESIRINVRIDFKR